MDLFSKSKVKCAGCGNTIDKKEAKVEALKKPWHAACFVCHSCHKPLKGDFRTVDDRPWCENCYSKSKAPKCDMCGKSITEKRIKTDDGRSFHEECFSKASQGTCFVCNSSIALSEPIIEALGKTFHDRCFNCPECGGRLPEKFHMENDRPICDKCHDKHKHRHDQEREHTETKVRDVEGRPDLREETQYQESTHTYKNDENRPTGTVVRDAGADFPGGREGNQMGRNDNNQFRNRVTNLRDDVHGTDCAVCGESTGDETHVMAMERHFHRQCLDGAYAGECHGCGQRIRLTEPSVGVARLGREWHVNCLSCSRCQQGINGAFQLYDNNPLCDGCHRQQSTPCSACGQGIEGDKLKALGTFWHPGCFNCAVCSVPLIEKGREFFNVGGRPYCKDDLEREHIAVA